MVTCDQTDYIEIACMFRYPVRLTLKSGAAIECTALDTARNESREECIKVLIKDNEQLVTLDDLAKMQVLVENPHFLEVSFS